MQRVAKLALCREHVGVAPDARECDGFMPNDIVDIWPVCLLPLPRHYTSYSAQPVHGATVWFLRSWTGYIVARAGGS